MSIPYSGVDRNVSPGTDLPPRDSQQTPIGAVSAEAQAQATAADLRSQVISRMRRMNVLHAQLAWQQRRRAPIAAYGLAFLFAYPDPRRPARFVLGAATRLWKAGPESAHVDRLLFDFDQHVASLSRDKPLDIRTGLANRCDPMPAEAVYTGVGLSSLDTHTGSWEQARDRVDSGSDIPGRILIVLSDRTLIVCERRGLNEFNEFQVHCTHSLEIASGRALHPYSWVDAEQLRQDSQNLNVLRFLEQLHETLWQADNAWLARRQVGPAHRLHGMPGVHGGGHGY